MKLNRLRISLLAAVCAAAVCCVEPASAGNIIGAWDFQNGVTGAFNMSPAPSVNNQLAGIPLATPLGMHNTYSFTTVPVAKGSIDGQDLIVTNGTGHAGATDQAWRVRGDTGNVYPAAQLVESNPSPPNDAIAVGNGWALAAPQYTQGAQFSFNTTGFQNLVFSYDYFSTNQGVRDQAIQFTADGGATWQTVGATSVGAGGILGVNVAKNTGGLVYNISTPNDFINGITVDFGVLGIHSVDNNPNFAVRIVSIYDPTFAPAGTTYTSATIANGAYNNNSGNWRYDNISLVSVPEPASVVMSCFGLVGLLFHGWRRRRAA